MRPDGTGLRKLADDSHELAFSDHAINGESDLFVMQANGKGGFSILN